MTSSDFRQIGDRWEFGKADHLFCAAVSAFCTLTRPSRREITQLEDLTLPLFDSVSAKARRYVAAKLAEIDHAPPMLVKRLCDEPTGIAAPLLIASKQLTDIELIRLIARHGLPHARAILRRTDLNPAIGNLVRAMEGPAAMRPESESSRTPLPSTETDGGNNAELMRQKLRAMMASSQDMAEPVRQQPPDRAELFDRLCLAALNGQDGLVHTIVARALGIDTGKARSIIEADQDELVTALCALDLKAEQAFLLTSTFRPGSFQQIADIRQFLEKYRLYDGASARAKLKTGSQIATGTDNPRMLKAS